MEQKTEKARFNPRTQTDNFITVKAADREPSMSDPNLRLYVLTPASATRLHQLRARRTSKATSYAKRSIGYWGLKPPSGSALNGSTPRPPRKQTAPTVLKKTIIPFGNGGLAELQAAVLIFQRSRPSWTPGQLSPRSKRPIPTMPYDTNDSSGDTSPATKSPPPS